MAKIKLKSSEIKRIKSLLSMEIVRAENALEHSKTVNFQSEEKREEVIEKNEAKVYELKELKKKFT